MSARMSRHSRNSLQALDELEEGEVHRGPGGREGSGQGLGSQPWVRTPNHSISQNTGTSTNQKNSLRVYSSSPDLESEAMVSSVTIKPTNTLSAAP